MSKDLVLNDEALEKAIDVFVDSVIDEDFSKAKKKKAYKDEDHPVLEDDKKEDEVTEEEEHEADPDEDEHEGKKPSAKVVRKNKDKHDEEYDEEYGTDGANAYMYKTGYAHGVQCAHGARDGMHKMHKSHPHYVKGFKDGHASAKEHLEMMKEDGEKKSMKKSFGESSALESIEKALNGLKEENSALKSSIEKLAKSPAPRKSLQGVDFVRKSQNDGKDVDIDSDASSNSSAMSHLNKSQQRARVAELLYEEGVKKGLLSAVDVADFEASDIAMFKSRNQDRFKKVERIIKKSIQDGTF